MAWAMARQSVLLGAIVMAGATATAEEPRMLPREVHAETVLVREGRPEAVVVAPAEGVWRQAAEQVAAGVERLTGARLPILPPEEVTQKDRPHLREEFRRRPVVFVGNVGVNVALFEPYVRGWFIVDEENLAVEGPNYIKAYTTRPERRSTVGWTMETFLDAWGFGTGYVLIGASREAEMPAAVNSFLRLCEKHRQGRTLALPRVCEPGPDDLLARAKKWLRLARPVNEDWLPKFKESRAMHLGYVVGQALHEFTLVTHVGAFTAEELNDIENELLENILMIPQKVWWYRGGRRTVGARHELYKNTRLYLAIEHLLTVGRPNAEARTRLETMARGIREYLHYAITSAHRSDNEDPEGDQAWQSALWYALYAGDWDYFTSGRAHEAARFALLETDNAGGQSGHCSYGDVENVFAPSCVRNVLRVAAWWYRDGRLKWLLEHLPFAHRYDYGFPLIFSLKGIPSRQPREWLGMQWMPLSLHSYHVATASRKWQQPQIPRARSVDLLAFRSGFGVLDQYLCLDGFQAQFQPQGVGTILRYMDLGKLFLVAHTGKEGNYYKSGVAVSVGARSEKAPSHVTEAQRQGPAPGELQPAESETHEPWGAEVVVGANLPNLALVALRIPEYHETEWTRFIFWRRGAYFVFLDQVRAQKPGHFMCTCTWRTWAPARLEGPNWVQRQGDVTFHLKPAFATTTRAGLAPAEEYQNEVVPHLLRQMLPLAAERAGQAICFQNLLYASSPERPVDYKVAQVSPTCVLVRGTREIALMGLGPSAEAKVSTDAALFYLSPERAGVASGKVFTLGGVEILRRQRRGNYEVPLPTDVAQVVRGTLEALWKKVAKTALVSQTAMPTITNAAVAWIYSDFQKHRCSLAPVEATQRNGEWWADLGEVANIESVRVWAPEKAEGIEVAFSNDDFRADVRMAKMGQASSQIIGPYGKSYYAMRWVVPFEGDRARYVRARISRGGTPPSVEILSPEWEPAHIVALEQCDFDPADGQCEILCRTRDNQVALLSEKGKLLWKRDFEHNVISTAVLDLEEKGRRDFFVVDAASTLWRLAADGRIIEQTILRTSDDPSSDFFRFNRAYCLGVWKADPAQKPSLILGTYQSIAWREPDGRLFTYPEHSDELPYRSGFVWRGLVYWERTLDRGMDFNGDGVEDQVFLARGWTATPTLMFFDGKTRDQFAEYHFPNGRTLGLQIVELGGQRRVLAVNEFKMMLCSLQGKEIWSVRFDTPAAAYAVNGNALVVAKRDGMLLLLNGEGRLVRTRLLAPELHAVATDGETILVASDEGLYRLDPHLNEESCLPLKARFVVTLRARQFAAGTADGKVVGLRY